VVAVVAGGIVALCPHPLDVQIRTPALEGTGAVFQTADCVVAVEESAVGEAFVGVYPFSLAIVDD
jgi:glutaminase